MGTGLIIDGTGVVLTNRHVVEGADEVIVRLHDDREFKATDIKTDPQTDLAVLHIDTKGEKLPAAHWGDSDKLSIGDWVLAIGHPFNLEATVSAGIISGKGRALDSVQRSNFLQTDAAINPGNSGGPLINLDGEVVGINTAIATNTGTYNGIGFAIPASTAKWVAGELMEHGRVRRAFLGVGIGEIGADLANRFGVKRREGVVVTEVHAETPAAKAGVEEGDVIMDFDGVRVGTPRELQALVEQAAINQDHKLNLLREGRPLELSIKLGELPETLGETRPASLDEEGSDEEPQSFEAKDLGLEVSGMTAEVARQLGYDGRQGVLVSAVEVDSVAWREGLREGMLILKVGKQRVTDVKEFETALEGQSLAEGILLQVRTPQGNRFLVLEKL
jgi:serine protease Do